MRPTCGQRLGNSALFGVNLRVYRFDSCRARQRINDLRGVCVHVVPKMWVPCAFGRAIPARACQDRAGNPLEQALGAEGVRGRWRSQASAAITSNSSFPSRSGRALPVAWAQARSAAPTARRPAETSRRSRNCVTSSAICRPTFPALEALQEGHRGLRACRCGLRAVFRGDRGAVLLHAVQRDRHQNHRHDDDEAGQPGPPETACGSPVRQASVQRGSSMANPSLRTRGCAIPDARRHPLFRKACDAVRSGN